MTKPDNLFRSFGMSGYQITEELKAVEKQHGIELGHLPEVNEDRTSYYPQFEQIVRAEASEMAKHYELFYCLEKSIRKLISETLEDSKGADWWNSGAIPQEVMESVRKNMSNEADSGVSIRSEEQIDYTTFGELSKIIISNWTLFEPIFTTRSAVQRVLSSLNLLRAPIAHCCPLQSDEIDRLDLTVRDWFRLIG